MRTIKMIGLAIVAVAAFSAFSVASASAAEFIYSKTGKFKGKQTTNQEYKTGGGATVVCKKSEPSGEVTKLKTTEQELTISSSECTVSGLGTASVTSGERSYFSGAILSLLFPVMIKATALGVKCAIDIPSGQTFSETGEVGYENKSGKLLVNNKVKGMVSEITESNSTGLCGKVGEKNTAGTYTGSMEVEVEGGTIEVK
jgi:hypothetical protein